ncbi:MAG: hypothetical protein IPG96_20030 [Proteobacteria bacterium]|nr:hypothetical protein [Pseudomonadota bacterium]
MLLGGLVLCGGRARGAEPSDPPAEHFLLRQRLDLPAIDGFARLAPAQGAVLERLQQASVLELHVYALGDRALMVLPRAHPAGELALLWHSDHDRLTVRAPDGWTHQLEREQLADVLDRAAPAERTLEPPVLEPMVAAQAATPAVRGPLRRGAWRLRARASYRPLDLQASPWAIRLKLDLQTSPLGLEGGPTAPLLFALALPLCTGRDGLLALEALAEQVAGTPVSWRLTVVNESLPGGRAPVWRTEVVDLGAAPLPERRFGLARVSRRHGAALRVSHQLPAPTVAGLQVVAPAQLAALRAPSAPAATGALAGASAGGAKTATGTAAEGRPAALLLHNQSATAALIYVDGVLLGWVAAGQSFAFAGLRPGFYRVFATTPTGVRSWGPEDLYLPGAWTLAATASSSG